LLTVARYIKGFERLEPDEMKVTSPVLRRGGASNRSFLFGKVASPVLRRGRASNRSFLFGGTRPEGRGEGTVPKSSSFFNESSN